MFNIRHNAVRARCSLFVHDDAPTWTGFTHLQRTASEPLKPSHPLVRVTQHKAAL